MKKILVPLFLLVVIGVSTLLVADVVLAGGWDVAGWGKGNAHQSYIYNINTSTRSIRVMEFVWDGYYFVSHPVAEDAKIHSPTVQGHLGFDDLCIGQNIIYLKDGGVITSIVVLHDTPPKGNH